MRGTACLRLRLFANEKEERLASRLHGYRDRPGREEEKLVWWANLSAGTVSECVCVCVCVCTSAMVVRSFHVRAVPLADITEYMKCGPLNDNIILTPNDDFSHWKTGILSTSTVIRLLVWGQGSRGSIARRGRNRSLSSASTLTVGSTRPAIQRVPEVPFPMMKLTSYLHPLWTLWLHGTVYTIMVWYTNWVQQWLIFTSKLRGFVPGIIPVSRHTKWPVGFRILSAAHRWLACAITSCFGGGFG